MTCKVSIILAVSKNNVLGDQGRLPWDMPEDLLYFRKMIKDKAVIVGYNTYYTLPSYVQKESAHLYVVTRDCEDFTALTLTEALEAAKATGKEVLVIGGAKVYAEAFVLADTVYLTRVNLSVEGDAKLMGFKQADWEEVYCQPGSFDDITFYTYHKKAADNPTHHYKWTGELPNVINF